MSVPPPTIHRGRLLLLSVGIFIVIFVLGMMIIGSMSLAEDTLRWLRVAISGFAGATSYWLAFLIARRGQSRWLHKDSPQA